MYSFRNIDNYIPREYEKVGALKDKLWFEDPKTIDSETGKRVRGLFKPRRKEAYRSYDLFCGNHYGEVAAYVLAQKISMPSCRSELVDVHTEKNKYTRGNIKYKKGAVVYSRLREREELISGKIITEGLKMNEPEEYERISQDPRCNLNESNNNNIEIILASIEYTMKKAGISEQRITEAKERMIQMSIFDCAFGNNDRHDENWSMSFIAKDRSTLGIYPAYDNERVLGLYENLDLISHAVNSDKVPEISEEVLTSRIGIPGKPEKVRYYELLEYLASHYPEETQKYIQAILDNVTSKDVLEMLSEMEELPPEYIEFGTLMFSERRKTLEKVLDNIKSKKEKPSNITPPISIAPNKSNHEEISL